MAWRTISRRNMGSISWTATSPSPCAARRSRRIISSPRTSPSPRIASTPISSSPSPRTIATSRCPEPKSFASSGWAPCSRSFSIGAISSPPRRGQSVRRQSRSRRARRSDGAAERRDDSSRMTGARHKGYRFGAPRTRPPEPDRRSDALAPPHPRHPPDPLPPRRLRQDPRDVLEHLSLPADGPPPARRQPGRRRQRRAAISRRHRDRVRGHHALREPAARPRPSASVWRFNPGDSDQVMTGRDFTLSIVIPVYNGAKTIGELVAALAALSIKGGHEIVLVNDGSRDNSLAVCRDLLRKCPVPLTVVDLARNFGEHNAVMAGLRAARGAWVVTMDDDLQNPPDEVVRLLEYAQSTGKAAIYTWYGSKAHAAWRNLGSRFTNDVADLLLDKPKGLYLSSFRCLSAFVVEHVTRYAGPFPYIDGLVLQVTQDIDRIEVKHLRLAEGRSNYTP